MKTDLSAERPLSASALCDAFSRVRARSVALTATLETEDYMVQSMPDASPPRWHLGHTTWFFEVFVLVPNGVSLGTDPRWTALFNSYYNGVGTPFPRALRGTQSRPTVREILAWREAVDAAVLKLATQTSAVHALIELGMHHEQQHQELLVTDLKHGFCTSPMKPTFTGPFSGSSPDRQPSWVSHPGGLVTIGHEGSSFAYDNEGPAHQALVEPHRLAGELVTNAEYLAFMQAGGYTQPDLWLSDGWATAQAAGWRAPLYWRQDSSGRWLEDTPGGPRPIDERAPVCHVSFFEADAFARWRGCRLPTEFEWEAAARRAGPAAIVTHPELHPTGTHGPAFGGHTDLFGQVWQWTSSAYLPYPRYRAPAGAVGEYNGKFMNGQRVLRGSSCATPAGHARLSYRNFFPPEKRWQFSGIRLAMDITPS